MTEDSSATSTETGLRWQGLAAVADGRTRALVLVPTRELQALLEHEKFDSVLRLARAVMAMGGLSGAVFNAAKEAALDAFLLGAVGFLDMAVLVEHVLEKLGPDAAGLGPDYDLGTVMDFDAAARRMAGVWVGAFSGR